MIDVEFNDTLNHRAKKYADHHHIVLARARRARRRTRRVRRQRGDERRARAWARSSATTTRTRTRAARAGRAERRAVQGLQLVGAGAHQAEWQVELPTATRARAAIGEGWVAAVTPRRLVRVWSLGGVPLDGGAPLCPRRRGRVRGGRGRRRAAYHRAAPSWAAADDVDDAAARCTGAATARARPRCLKERRALPARGGARARRRSSRSSRSASCCSTSRARRDRARAPSARAGRDAPVARLRRRRRALRDGPRGALLTLSPAFGWRWACALDTVPPRRSGDDYRPVAVRRGQLMAVTLKGGVLSPATHPRPVLTQIALAAPHASGRARRGRARAEAELGRGRARARARARARRRPPRSRARARARARAVARAPRRRRRRRGASSRTRSARCTSRPRSSRRRCCASSRPRAARTGCSARSTRSRSSACPSRSRSRSRSPTPRTSPRSPSASRRSRRATPARWTSEPGAVSARGVRG